MLDVRHSVFVLGFAGVGKSKVWGTLNRTYKNQGKKPSAIDLDPKAVTNNELFGIINPSTREWKDGKHNSSWGLIKNIQRKVDKFRFQLLCLFCFTCCALYIYRFVLCNHA